MGSKQEILQALRRRPPTSPPLPALDGPWTTYHDRLQQFTDVLSAVGGASHRCRSISEVSALLNQLPVVRQSQTVCSTIAGIEPTNLDLASIDDPHQLQTVDVAIARGEFGVAENGAVWVGGDRVRHRVLYFVCQHLVLVLPADQIVDNMHQASARLDVSQGEFGCFISGPSKTADIEQSLVIGAHGPRSLNVLLIDSWDDG